MRLARGLAATFVVTGDDRVAAIAADGRRGSDSRKIGKRRNRRRRLCAQRELKSAGCEAVLIMPGDMPLLRASDVESVLSAGSPRRQGAIRFARAVARSSRHQCAALGAARRDRAALRL